VSVSQARTIAFDVLSRVEASGAYASDALHQALDKPVKPADAALATELTMGVLRWGGLLDFLLNHLSNKPVSRLDTPVAIALRLGLYQLRFMHKIPARAAVHESVELVKRARKASAGTFVNAILRKASDQSLVPADKIVRSDLPPAERLAILHSHPQWMVERWLARFGESETTALLEANNRAPRLTCSLNSAAARGFVFEELGREDIKVEPGRLLANAFTVQGGSPSRTKAFREGRISIQDEASQAVPLLLGVQQGERVLDLCAAPGGKTALLARAVGERGFVVAADIYVHRLQAAEAQFARLHLGRIGLVAVDAEKPLPFSAQFDAVLVDAPCSGTGTLARHPEIRWRLSAAQLAEFHALQVNILRNAIAQAAPGAKILYSTCSMEPEENEEVVAEALRNGGVRRAQAQEMVNALVPYLAQGVEAKRFINDNAEFRTLPHGDGADGFFATLLRKTQ
jgi:16S rRNA (cytosine967-C5)-methyltransferase